MQRFRFQCDFGLAHDDVFGISAIARRIWFTKDFVTFFESRYSVPDFLNHTRKVPAKNYREFVPNKLLEVTLSNLPIGRVHASGMHADQDFTLSRLRARRVF